MNHLLLLLITFLTFFWPVCVTATNVADTYGLSPKGMSMGNAMTAHVNDWSAVYYNIAGLGRTRHFGENMSYSEVFAGLTTTAPQTDLEIPQRFDGDGASRVAYSTNADDDLDFSTYIIGTALDLNKLYKMPNPISSARFGLALAIGSDLTLTKVNDIEPQSHNYLRYGRENQELLIINGVGIGFLDDAFGIGIGVKSVIRGEGRVLIRDVDVSTDQQIPPSQARMDLKMDLSSWIVGAYIDVGKIVPQLGGFNMGISYREKSYLEIDPFETLALTSAGSIPLEMKLAILDFFQPAVFDFGVSYRFMKRYLVALDIEHQAWSDYVVSSQQMFNNTDILPEVDDIIVPKIGLQVDVSKHLQVSGGYFYQASFIPDDATTGAVNWLDNNKHVASIGMRYKVDKQGGLQKPVVLQLAYQFQYLEERDVVKTEETSMNPNYSYGGTVHTVSLGASF